MPCRCNAEVGCLSRACALLAARSSPCRRRGRAWREGALRGRRCSVRRPAKCPRAFKGVFLWSFARWGCANAGPPRNYRPTGVAKVRAPKMARHSCVMRVQAHIPSESSVSLCSAVHLLLRLGLSRRYSMVQECADSLHTRSSAVQRQNGCPVATKVQHRCNLEQEHR